MYGKAYTIVVEHSTQADKKFISSRVSKEVSSKEFSRTEVKKINNNLVSLL